MSTSERVGLVRQTNAHQRAARTLWAVDQGRRCLVASSGTTQIGDQLQGPGNQCVVELNTNPLSRFGEVQVACIAAIAGVAQQQTLYAQLHTLGFPRALLGVRRRAALPFDRADGVAIALYDVQLCGQS
jgi:hypothetical protein